MSFLSNQTIKKSLILASLIACTSQLFSGNFQGDLGKKIKSLKTTVESKSTSSKKLEAFCNVISWVAEKIYDEKKVKKICYKFGWKWENRLFKPTFKLFEQIINNISGQIDGKKLIKVVSELIDAFRGEKEIKIEKIKKGIKYYKSSTKQRKDKIAYLHAKKWLKKIETLALSVDKTLNIQRQLELEKKRQALFLKEIKQLKQAHKRLKRQSEESLADSDRHQEEDEFTLEELQENNQFIEDTLKDLTERIQEVKKMTSNSSDDNDL